MAEKDWIEAAAADCVAVVTIDRGPRLGEAVNAALSASAGKAEG